MKLLSVKILNNDGFRSLNPNENYKFGNSSLQPDQLTTKIFAGINGSGKSNFLELLSEIFYYLEIYHLPGTSKEEKAHKGIGFEIEYLISLPSAFIEKHYSQVATDKHIQVRITKSMGEEPEFSIKRLYDDNYTMRIDTDTASLLPARIIAYTSGQNELLSNAYHKLKYHYFQNYQQNNTANSKTDHHRMIFLDTCVNSSIFIANILLAEPNKLNYLLKIVGIESLNSFRITINQTDDKNIPIDFPEHIRNHIENLKQCATTWVERKIKKKRNSIS